MTDAQFLAWLKSDKAYRCVLVEAVARVSGVETTRYMSNRGYVTTSADTPASQHYEPLIVGGCSITESLTVGSDMSTPGSTSMVFGDIELDNTEGNLDAWLNDIWANRSVKMYVGDMSWPRSDFRLVFDGLADDMDSRNRGVLNLKVRDKLQQLNTTVSETTLGGSSSNSTQLLPIVLGEVHNISPLLTNKATLEYQYNIGVTERVIEVRDNGVVITPTVTLSTGKMTLAASPAGTITMSVQGLKLSGTYVNTAAKLIQLLVINYGTTPFVSGDIDTSMTAFDAANTQPLGVYLSETQSVLTLCQDLAASIGAQLVMTADGKLKLVKIDLAGTTPTAVNSKMMAEMSLEMARRIPVIAGVKLNYCQNWTVQDTLVTGIPAEHKDLYAKEWLVSTATDATTATNYKITKAPEPINTYLLTKTTADAESTRRLNLWKTQRCIYRYEGMPELMLEVLGNYQTITHTRFGMSLGLAVQTTMIERDWLNMTVNFEVLG